MLYFTTSQVHAGEHIRVATTLVLGVRLQLRSALQLVWEL